MKDFLKRMTLFFAILWTALAAFAGTLAFLDAAARGLGLGSDPLALHRAGLVSILVAAALAALIFVFYLGMLHPLWNEKPPAPHRDGAGPAAGARRPR